MLIIEGKKNESIERILKRYKSKVSRTKVIKNFRDKKIFIKKSARKRTEKQKAIYIENKYRHE